MTSPTPDELVEAATIEQADETGRVLEQRAASKAERPGLTVTNDGRDATLVGQPTSGEPEPIEDFLRAFGLDPAEWLVISCTANRWESAAKVGTEWIKTKLHQKKAVLKSLRPVVLPARIDGPQWRPSIDIKPLPGRPLLVVVFGDHQAPYHDAALHELFLEWVARNKPDWAIHIGDLGDFSSWGKYQRKPKLESGDRAKEAQRSIDDGYQILRDVRQAGGKRLRRFDMLPDNHGSQRLQNFLLQEAEAIYGIRPAGETAPLISLRRFWRLDELGINYVEGETNDYPGGMLEITPKLWAAHGWLVAKQSGQSGLKHLETLGHSIIHGHTHRLGLVYKSYREGNRRTRTHVAIETGCMCRMDLGYSAALNWQQGWATLRLFDDGTFTPSLASYVNDVLLWEGQTYRHSAKGVRVA